MENNNNFNFPQIPIDIGTASVHGDEDNLQIIITVATGRKYSFTASGNQITSVKSETNPDYFYTEGK